MSARTQLCTPYLSCPLQSSLSQNPALGGALHPHPSSLPTIPFPPSPPRLPPPTAWITPASGHPSLGLHSLITYKHQDSKQEIILCSFFAFCNHLSSWVKINPKQQASNKRENQVKCMCCGRLDAKGLRMQQADCSLIQDSWALKKRWGLTLLAGESARDYPA